MQAEKPEAGVAVDLHRPGRELERIAPDELVDGVAGDRGVPHQLHRAHLRHLAEIDDAGRVIEEAAQRHLVAASVEVRQPLRDVVVEAELPLVAQLEDRDGGELLGDGADRDHRVHGHRHVAFDVGLAVRLEEQRVLSLDDGGDDADGAVPEHPGAGDGVQLLDDLGGGDRGSQRDQGERDDQLHANLGLTLQYKAISAYLSSWRTAGDSGTTAVPGVLVRRPATPGRTRIRRRRGTPRNGRRP